MLILVQRITDEAPGPWQVGAKIGSPESRGLDEHVPFATVLGTNPLGVAGPVPSEVLRGSRVALSSGWLEAEAGEISGGSMSGVSGVDPRTWGPRGWASFEGFCRELCVRMVGSSTRVCFRPRATDVLSDAPSCDRFLRAKPDWGDTPGHLELLLDPAAMLAGAMLGAAEDHVGRVLEQLAGAPGVCAVMLTNVEAPAQSGGLPCAAPLHRGLIAPASLVRMARELIPAATPIALLEQDLEEQRSMLEA